MGVWVMSKCPFWSNKRKRVSCNDECPMSPTNNNNETCPFVEHLTGERVTFKGIVDENFAYSQEESNLEYIIPSYIEYKDQ